MALKADRGRNWTDEETLVLISVWSDDVVQTELEGCYRNQHVFQKMSDELKKQGYKRSWEKCREKVKKLKKQYKEVIDNNKETGRKRKTFKYFTEMDGVLGHRPAIRPPVVISSSGKSSSFLDSGEESSVEELEETQSIEVPISEISTSSVVEVSGYCFKTIELFQH